MKYSNLVVSILELLDTTEDHVYIPHGTFEVKDWVVRKTIRQLRDDELISPDYSEIFDISANVGFVFGEAPHLTPKGAKYLQEMRKLRQIVK